MTAHCHVHIRAIAKEIAGKVYDRLMGDNLSYEAWRKANPGASAKELEHRFVETKWGMMVAAARQYLAEQLRNPNIPEAQKLQIVDVLAKDQSLVRGRRDVRGTSGLH